MKILLLNLLNPPGIRVLRDFGGGFGTASTYKKGRLHTIFPPLHEAIAAAMLERKGYEVSIFDCQTQNQEPTKLLTQIERQEPAIIICRVSAPSLDSDLAIISGIKERLPNTFLMGWGSLCKMAPQEILDKSKLDLVMGEVELEFGIVHILERLLEKGFVENGIRTSLKTNIRYLDLSERRIIRDLDMMPPPAYHLLDMKNYVAEESGFIPGGSKNKPVPFFSVLGSHGCSFNCMYCVYPIIFGPWRGRSPEKMVNEVETLVNNYGIKVIWFEDQVFSMSIKRAITICDEIIKRGLTLQWACETRASKLSNALLKKMKKAGCSRIQIGIETGDPELFKKIGKAGCDLKTAEQNIRAAQKEGILVEANFIVGLPGESWQTVKNTATFIDRLVPDVFSVSIATPYPGTPLYQMAEQNNWILTRDWNKYGLSSAVMSMPTFTNQDMEKAQEYLVSEASFKRQWKIMINDLQHVRLGKIANDVLLNLPEMPKQVYRWAKGKSRSTSTCVS